MIRVQVDESGEMQLTWVREGARVVSEYTPEFYFRQWVRDKDYGTEVPYTEEAWATLLVMKDRIGEIAAFLEKLRGRKDFGKLLNNPKGNLLLGPKPFDA